MKSRLIAGDVAGAREDARGRSMRARRSRRARSAATQRRSRSWSSARTTRRCELAATLAGAEAIPPAVVDSIAALAMRDAPAYERRSRALVVDFEARDEFLEDIAVADTVLALQALAARARARASRSTSPLLPER